jgi:ERCC4-type nuclease
MSNGGLLLDPKGGVNKHDRTYTEELASHLDSLKVPYQIVGLRFADVAFLGEGPEGPVSIGIEVKRVPDLLTSLTGGRLLGHQVPGLLEDYDRAWLIVEGVTRLSRRTGLLEGPRGGGWRGLGYGKRPARWKDIEAALAKIEYQGRIPVRRTRSTYETAATLRVLYDYCSKPWDKHSPWAQASVVREPMVPDTTCPTERLLRQIASCLPGVGWDRAVKAAKYFPSVELMLEADEATWRDALGLTGKKSLTVQRLLEALHAPKVTRTP